jgi:aromatic ring-opening dioxygenase catalytic subunit (LigB family)
MGLQKVSPDFLLIAPGGRLHALELMRKGEEMTKEQQAFGAWCRKQDVPFACTGNLREALVILTGWGSVAHRLSNAGVIVPNPEEG